MGRTRARQREVRRCRRTGTEPIVSPAAISGPERRPRGSPQKPPRLPRRPPLVLPLTLPLVRGFLISNTLPALAEPLKTNQCAFRPPRPVSQEVRGTRAAFGPPRGRCFFDSNASMVWHPGDASWPQELAVRAGGGTRRDGRTCPSHLARRAAAPGQERARFSPLSSPAMLDSSGQPWPCRNCFGVLPFGFVLKQWLRRVFFVLRETSPPVLFNYDFLFDCVNCRL